MNINRLAHILAYQQVGHGPTKIATSEDTQMFVEYIMLKREEVDPQAVIKFLERNGVERGERTTNTGQPLKRGEYVSIKADKAPGHLQDILEPLQGNIAQVAEVDGDDVVLKMMGQVVPYILGAKPAPRNSEVRVDGGVMTGAKTGLYRHSYGVQTQGTGRIFEIIYLSDVNAAPPSQDQIDAVRKYVEEGLLNGEKRSESYYTGQISKVMTNKGGQDYFTMGSQQRGTARPTTINPTKGTVLYIGIMGKRPGGWMNEYLEMVAGAASMEG